MTIEKTAIGGAYPFQFHDHGEELGHELVVGSTTYAMSVVGHRKKTIRCPTCGVTHVWAESERGAHMCCGQTLVSPWAA